MESDYQTSEIQTLGLKKKERKQGHEINKTGDVKFLIKRLLNQANAPAEEKATACSHLRRGQSLKPTQKWSPRMPRSPR